jgi:hypothetical protein
VYCKDSKAGTKTAGKKEKKEGQKLEAWWLKSNFMSFLNLTPMTEELVHSFSGEMGVGRGRGLFSRLNPT